MKSLIIPTVERCPDQICLHIGTNDLKSKEPNVVADAIVDLAREIENSCDVEIVLSEITTRNDAHSDAVKTVNRRLKQFSRQNGWKLISHANITQNGLNKGGLHLNREGNDSLHRNFVNFLRNNNWSPGSLNAESPVSVKPPYVSRSNTSHDLNNIRKTAASKSPCLPNSLPANRGFKIV